MIAISGASGMNHANDLAVRSQKSREFSVSDRIRPRGAAMISYRSHSKSAAKSSEDTSGNRRNVSHCTGWANASKRPGNSDSRFFHHSDAGEGASGGLNKVLSTRISNQSKLLSY